MDGQYTVVCSVQFVKKGSKALFYIFHTFPFYAYYKDIDCLISRYENSS